MNYQFPPDVAKIVSEQMASGGYASEDDLLRDALKALVEHQHTVICDDPDVVEGVRRGLDEMNRGLGRNFKEFDSEFRGQYKLYRDA